MKLRSGEPVWMPRLAWIAAATCCLLLFLSPAARGQRLERDNFRNGSAVRKAFRRVVADSRRSTVRIESDGKQTALGVIVDPAGFVLTKASELEDSPVCRLGDGRELTGRLVGLHRELDLAMLKIEAEDLPAVKWSEGKDAPVGAWLATPGTGADPIAVGVVGAARRGIRPRRAVLGIVIEDIDLGPKITRVFPNSGAARAGLKVDDVITRVAGQAVKTRDALTRALGEFRPGDSLSLLVRRGEVEKTVRATLGDPVSTLPNRGNLQNQLGGRLSERRAGFSAVLQHDTVLKPSECGGVVVGLDGLAAGLNIARAGRIETYALPATLVVPLLDDLKSGKLAPPQYVAAEDDEPAPPALPEDADE